MVTRSDVSSTLSDLERRLRELERELDGAAASPAAPVAPPAPPALDPDVQRVVAEAQASLSVLHDQLDDLVRVREELEHSTRELIERYGRVLGAFGPAAAGTTATITAPAP